MQIKTPIIPISQRFAGVKAQHSLNLEAICVFTAIGFFLDTDTYWKDQVVLKPASYNTLDNQNSLVNFESWFKWHYTPRVVSFNDVVEEFGHLFETIISEQSKGHKVILPLSGGLDSRTQAVALRSINADVFSYGYHFENGYKETKIAKQIANACNFDFRPFTIPSGYLWDKLDKLSKLNQCYSDFTAPRQMAIYDEFDTMGTKFNLGHWGDVLFDSMDLPQLSKEEELEIMQLKLLKKGGLELATKLWAVWGLSGDFKTYYKGRIEKLLDEIQIENTNAKLRAFKSLYWAPRWTSVNLSVFKAKHPIGLPYYDNRMCEFICSIPEDYLKNRQIQIAYIKNKAPELAKITWQEMIPFNLNNYRLNKAPYNIPYKLANKVKRLLKEGIGKTHVLRNWELQFLGKSNQLGLDKTISMLKSNNCIPEDFINHTVDDFKLNPNPKTAHQLNMILAVLYQSNINND